MTVSSPIHFNKTKLDENLLVTPYEVITRWHVISGGPSCGKTTLINLLADRKFQTAPEGARLYLERELARGRTLEEIRANSVRTEQGIAETQLELERKLPPDECIFLDRAIPDCLAWYRIFGMNPNDLLPECFHFRYASVFLLDQLPLSLNGLRYKDPEIQCFTEEWHLRDYKALGYRITRVPVMPPERRLEFVLSILTGKAWD